VQFETCPHTGKQADKCTFNDSDMTQEHVNWHIAECLRIGVLEPTIIMGREYLQLSEGWRSSGPSAVPRIRSEPGKPT
jgi:hypothetical protein